MTFATRPVMQISTVLYYQLHVNEIVEKYCVNTSKPKLQCNGKCYLSKQLQLQNTSSETPQDSAVMTLESFIPLYFQENELLLTLFHCSWKTDKHWGITMIHPLEVSFDILHPPEFS